MLSIITKNTLQYDKNPSYQQAMTLYQSIQQKPSPSINLKTKGNRTKKSFQISSMLSIFHEVFLPSFSCFISLNTHTRRDKYICDPLLYSNHFKLGICKSSKQSFLMCFYNKKSQEEKVRKKIHIVYNLNYSDV